MSKKKEPDVQYRFDRYDDADDGSEAWTQVGSGSIVSGSGPVPRAITAFAPAGTFDLSKLPSGDPYWRTLAPAEAPKKKRRKAKR